jgi:ATPase subunit of ABC transporter with duplicated ATPase domains
MAVRIVGKPVAVAARIVRSLPKQVKRRLLARAYTSALPGAVGQRPKACAIIRRFAPALPLSTTVPNVITAANVTIQFGAKPLFENVSMKFGNGNRYGLIGANGSGKSTFMKILSGEIQPTSGNVSVDSDERIGILRQDQFAFEEFSALDTVIMGHERLWQIKQEKDSIYALSEMTEAQGMRVADLESEFAELDGYSAESSAGELLLGLGIPLEQHYGPMSAIAPGWKLRVLLAQALFADPDIMLLDEPTNNLDINAIRWLESILNQRNCTMIIISHDRHFLNSVCTHMVDLDYGALRLYPGTYDDFMLASTQARERLQTDNARKKTQIAELQAFVSRFSANASKARQATSRARQIEKIKLDEIKPSSRVNPYIRFEQDKKLHRNALEIKRLALGYEEGQPLISNLDLMIEVGERVAVLGPNGIGKTTLMEALNDRFGEDADRGWVTGAIKWSENVSIGYYAQDHKQEFDSDINLFDWMTQWAKPSDDEQSIRAVLGRLLFSKDDSLKKVRVLSGGEKGRMLFGKMMLQKPNILVLDEPTNHLDMESIESLNLALENYPGTLVFVSHDREFVSSLATRIVELLPDRIENFKGTYDEYLHSQGIE